MLGLLRAAYVLVAALVTVTLLPRLGVPLQWLPDLVLIAVVATAVLRGPLQGALVGIAAGWVVELVPPVGSPMGLTPLILLAAGAVAGTFRSRSSRSALRPLVALLAACLVVLVGRAAAVVIAEGALTPAEGLGRLVSTLAVGLVLLPLFLSIDRALVRRRLG